MKKYVYRYPKNAESYSSLAYLLYRMGRIDDAIDQIKKSIKINISLGGNGILPGMLFMKEEYAEGMEWQDKIHKTRKTESLRTVSLWWKSFDLFWVGRIKEALNILKTYENNEQSEKWWIARADWLWGWIYYNKGSYELSKKYFIKYFDYEKKDGKILDVNVINAKSAFYNGLIDLKLGRIDSARINLRKLISFSKKINIKFINNEFSNYHLLYGRILIEEDSLDKAEVVLENKSPNKLHDNQATNWSRVNEFTDPLLQDDLALVYIKNGKLIRAIVEYEKLISLDVKIRGQHFINPKYHYRLAKLYEETNMTEKAVLEYKKFLKFWKNADEDLPELIDAKKRLERLIKK